MIVPMQSGRTIIPVYIPQPVVSTNSGMLQQSNNTQTSEPTLATWIGLGVVVILFIALVAYFIKELKEF